jgi:transcriptional regulator with XRE-family HTH domain
MGGKHRPGSPKDRALGAELRSIRLQTSMSLADVANQIQWNVSTLSRLERGQRHISPEAVMGLAMVYRLPADRRDELVERAKKPVALGWWDRPPFGVPADLGALASYENEAIQMVGWSSGIMPGLFQTPDYTRAVMDDWGVAPSDVEPRLRARLQRQQLLDRRHLDYTALISMAALTNQLCPSEQFLRQLKHLHRLSHRAGITVRAVAAPTTFAFASWYVMNFEDAGPVVVLEHLGSSTFLFDEETDPYLAAARKLTELALSVRATRDTIEEIIERVVTGS